DALPEHHLARGHRADRALDPLHLGTLDQVATGAGAYRGEDRVRVFAHGQHQYRHLGMGGGQLPGRVDPAAVGQVQVHEDHIGRQIVHKAQCGSGVRGLAHHRHRAGVGERGPHPGPEHRVIVDYEHLDHATSTGNPAVTRVPPPGNAPALNVPPSSVARSAIERSPTPLPFTGSGNPIPSSVTVTVSRSATAISTRHRRAHAWRATLVTASRAIRYAATSTAAGSVPACSGISTSASNPAAPATVSTCWRTAAHSPSSSN